jgi:predicted small metal-binding protein
MATTALHCDCGFEASAGDENELVAEVQRHAQEKHGMTLSREEVLVLAFRAELGESTQTPSARTEGRGGAMRRDRTD